MVLDSKSFAAALPGSSPAIASVCSLLAKSPHLQIPLTASFLSAKWNSVSKNSMLLSRTRQATRRQFGHSVLQSEGLWGKRHRIHKNASELLAISSVLNSVALRVR